MEVVYGKLYIVHPSLGGPAAVEKLHSLCPDRIAEHNGSWNLEETTYFGMIRPVDPQVDEVLTQWGFTILTPLGHGPLPDNEIALLADHATRSRGSDEHIAKKGDQMHDAAKRLYSLHGNPHLKPTFY